jgi:hypothetical protein
MASASVIIGAGEGVFQISPGQTHTAYFWLYHDHERSFVTSVTYDNGYHYNRHFFLIITPGHTATFDIGDAPAPTLTFDNESMGTPYYQLVEVPSGTISDQTISDAIKDNLFLRPQNGQTIDLKYGEAYEITAQSAYSATEYYSNNDALYPEPGYTYKVMPCGEEGVHGQNCGLFSNRVEDGGWYNPLGQ